MQELTIKFDTASPDDPVFVANLAATLDYISTCVRDSGSGMVFDTNTTITVFGEEQGQDLYDELCAEAADFMTDTYYAPAPPGPLCFLWNASGGMGGFGDYLAWKSPDCDRTWDNLRSQEGGW